MLKEKSTRSFCRETMLYPQLKKSTLYVEQVTEHEISFTKITQFMLALLDLPGPNLV